MPSSQTDRIPEQGPGCNAAWHRIIARLAIYEGMAMGRPTWELRGTPRPPDTEHCALAREWRLQHGADPGFGFSSDGYPVGSVQGAGGEGGEEGGCDPIGAECVDGGTCCTGICVNGFCSGMGSD